MKVTYLNAQPVGFHAESYLKAINYSDLQNPSLRGKAYIGTRGVLFKISKFRNPVKITLVLNKLGGTEFLADADLTVPAGSPDKFVLFEEFPSKYSSNFCQYELWLLNSTPNGANNSATVDVEVLYRTK